MRLYLRVSADRLRTAPDEHYYVKPEWFYEHVDFYDRYPRNVRVFSGEYAAHPASQSGNEDANTLEGALAEAAFLTGVEQNADVVVLASYAPLFSRVGYSQWAPDLIWFDEKKAYATPSYYVQKMYGNHMGTVVLDLAGQEKKLREERVYVTASMDEGSKELIVKAVNHNDVKMMLEMKLPQSWTAEEDVQCQVLKGDPKAYNSISDTDKVCPAEYTARLHKTIELEPQSFSVLRIKIKSYFLQASGAEMHV